MCRISYVDKDRISIIILKTCSQLHSRIVSVTIHHITQYSPRKPLKIWAAFWDSPGRLNECIRLEPPCVAMVCPSCSETSAAIQKRWNLIVWKAIWKVPHVIMPACHFNHLGLKLLEGDRHCGYMRSKQRTLRAAWALFMKLSNLLCIFIVL